jgi:hypothetical protein
MKSTLCAVILTICVNIAGPRAQAQTTVDPHTYVIAPRDVLRISIWRQPDLSKVVKVRQDGKITLGLIGDVQASGLTPERLTAQLKDAYSPKILNPEVNVVLIQTNKATPAPAPASGQPVFRSQSVSKPKLANGASVYYQWWQELDADYRPPQNAPQDIDVSGNAVVRRWLRNDGSIWFGYQVHFDKAGDAAFKVSFTPITGVPFFEQAPEPREIRDGERVMMNVLEEPKTGRKAFDVFQVCLPGTPGAFLPLPYENGVPAIIPVGTELRLSHARFRLGNRMEQARDNGISMDSHVSMNVPNFGRFSFSSSPGPGYKLEALAEGNNLRFIGGSEEHAIEADTQIVDQAGAWLLWVRFDPSPSTVSSAVKPKVIATSEDGPAPLEITATPTTARNNSSIPALSLQVKNVSTKNILAYEILTLFTNPETGRGIAQNGMGSTFISTITDKAEPMLPGAIKIMPMPVNFPQNARGVKPQYSLTVDLVVFDDGSTWGRAAKRASQDMFQSVQLWLANHSTGSSTQTAASPQAAKPKAAAMQQDGPAPLE